MSRYFQHFPTVEYNGEIVTDITRRVKVAERLGRSTYAMLPLTVRDGETAEEVAYYYYGDTAYVWIVYHSNNIFDPYTQWPLSNEDLLSTFKKKHSKTVTFTSSASNVSVVNDTLTIAGHGFKTSDPVIYTGSSIGGLTSGTTYYVVRIDSNTIKLATSAENSLLATPVVVNITSVGSKTQTLSRDMEVFTYSTVIETNVAYVEDVADSAVTINYETYKLSYAPSTD